MNTRRVFGYIFLAAIVLGAVTLIRPQLHLTQPQNYGTMSPLAWANINQSTASVSRNIPASFFVQVGAQGLFVGLSVAKDVSKYERMPRGGGAPGVAMPAGMIPGRITPNKVPYSVLPD